MPRVRPAAPVAPVLQQRFHRVIAQRSAQYLVHAFGHALQRTADMDHRAMLHPVAQRIDCSVQSILHVAAVAITRERQVHPRQMAIGLPGLDFFGKQEVVRALAFAKQQPMPVLASMGGFAQQAAQASDAGAVADQQHRRARHAMEPGIAVHAGDDAGADRCMQ